MIDFVVRFKNSFGLLVFLILAIFLAFWVYIRLKNKPGFSLIPMVVINFVLLLAWACLFEIDHDGVAHLHLSWLISQGLIPYRDFWQHHPPFLGIILAPFMISIF